ncbi:hypothetical protein V6N13_031270 [Hibiscus sabdariffa]
MIQRSRSKQGGGSGHHTRPRAGFSTPPVTPQLTRAATWLDPSRSFKEVDLTVHVQPPVTVPTSASATVALLGVNAAGRQKKKNEKKLRLDRKRIQKNQKQFIFFYVIGYKAEIKIV